MWYKELYKPAKSVCEYHMKDIYIFFFASTGQNLGGSYEIYKILLEFIKQINNTQ